jgi:DNA-binding transcriptional LysR family regulator
MTGIFSKNGVSLERLQTLGKVVRAGSIALAAKGDPVAQSQISRQIGDLEKVLGLELLDRTKKPFQPTRAAVRLADSCERFVREVEEVSLETRGLRRPITVGAGEVVIREFLIPLIGKQSKGKASVAWVMRNLTWRKIQEGLAAERLDVGLASGLEATGNVKVTDLESYGMKLVLPENEKPDKRGWKRLTDTPVVVMDGDGKFRQFLAECEREHGVILKIGAECTSYPQAVDLAEVAGWAVFVPELWWKRRKEWAARTQALPGLENHRRTLQLGWNRKVAERRPEVERLVKALGGRK